MPICILSLTSVSLWWLPQSVAWDTRDAVPELMVEYIIS
jgi:hypothetical protein